MPYRYCPECDKWLDMGEYTVNKSGETVCPDHKATHGFIDEPMTERVFRKSHSWIDDMSDEIDAAKRQGLIE